MKFEDVERGYANLWAKMQVKGDHLDDSRRIAARLRKSIGPYEGVSEAIGCPWWFIAIIHELEAAGDFTKHLHNGDPLTARTVHVPAGRPATGEPPFMWEDSAEDALRMRGIDKIGAANWSIPRALFEFEAYNGFGYWGKINSPYVWSFSNLYTSGKYVADHVYDPNAVSGQCGAAVILRAMIDLGYVVEPQQEIASMDDLKNLLQQMAGLAPAIATAIGGPLAGIAVQVVAKEIGASDMQPQSVVEKLHELGQDIPALIAALKRADNQVSLIAQPATMPAAPQAPAAPATAVPIAAAPQAMPKLSTGPMAFLDGYKTYLGAAICVAGFVAFYLHYITADVSNAIIAIGAGIGGVGLADRWAKARAIIPILPALPAPPA